MKSKLKRFGVSFVLIAILCGPAVAAGFYDTEMPRTAKCHFPKMIDHDSYLTTRKRILRSGFSVFLQRGTGAEPVCDFPIKECKRFPELETCSAQGECRLRFVDKTGTILEVVTGMDQAPNKDLVFGWDVFCASDPTHRSPW